MWLTCSNAHESGWKSRTHTRRALSFAACSASGRTDADDPDLRAFAGVFLEADSPAALNRATTDLLEDVVKR